MKTKKKFSLSLRYLLTLTLKLSREGENGKTIKFRLEVIESEKNKRKNI